MQQQFGLIRRPWGVYYLKNKVTGEQTSLKTRDNQEAQRLLQAHNDTHFNLALARVYMNGGSQSRLWPGTSRPPQGGVWSSWEWF